MISQNGYQVLETNRTDGPLPRLRKWHIPGVDRHIFLRDGSAGFLLVYLAMWFHENVEKLDAGVWDEWGWAVRPVRGQSSGYSNHASGTAEDLNATKHPRGVATRNTFSAAEIATIHAHLGLYQGCIRWGGDYTKTPDAMHFELVKGLADVERRARELSLTPRGQKILNANPGASNVIWDGKPPPTVQDKKPEASPKPSPKPEKKPDRLAADWSYARPNPASVKAAGIRGVIRYVSPKAAKNLTKQEAAAIHRAGLWIALVWESVASRAQAGAPAGRADAREAEAQADALGYPKDAVIFYAVDFDATPTAILPYFRGLQAVAKRPVGVYGSARVLDAVKNAGLADYFWQTMAWSHGNVSNAANWLQRVTRSVKIRGSKDTDWDENLLIGGGVPVWRPEKPSSPPAPKPSPKPEPRVPEVVTKPEVEPVPEPSPAPEPEVPADVPVVVEPTPVPEPPAPPAPATKTLRVGTWNVLHGREIDIVLGELIRLSNEVDVLMLQECNGYRSILQKVPGFVPIAFYGAREQAESPILVREGLNVTRKAPVQLTADPDGSGPGIAGWITTKGSQTPAKWGTFVGIDDDVTCLSFHTPPTVESVIQRLAAPRRWRAYQELMGTATNVIRSVGGENGHVVVGADWNVNVSKDDGKLESFPRSALAQAGMVRAIPSAPTHGKRTIDYFGVKGGTIDGIRVLDGYASDHKPVVGVLTY